MIVVIQCAGSKRRSANTMTGKDGTPVSFVAQPTLAPPRPGWIHARPDDQSDQGISWRAALAAYNERPGNNPQRLLRAFELYENEIYRALPSYFGIDKTYILSAGWGLIPAGFLTPSYDITFSHQAPPHVRRRHSERYADFRMLPHDTTDPIAFFGSKEYAPLFAALTEGVRTTRTVFYNSIVPPSAPGCLMKRYDTRTRMNWQYECAGWFLRSGVAL